MKFSSHELSIVAYRYLCLENVFGGELSAKSDVYFFGVILLELFTRQ
jgi:hypothetical protein